MTDEQIAKLPKWAQEHIRMLENQRIQAQLALDDFLEQQKKSPFYIEDWMTREADGRTTLVTKKLYLQTDRVCVNHGGVDLAVQAKDDGIEVRWRDDRRITEHVPSVPTSYQTILIAKIAPGIGAKLASKGEAKAEPAPTGRVRRVRG